MLTKLFDVIPVRNIVRRNEEDYLESIEYSGNTLFAGRSHGEIDIYSLENSKADKFSEDAHQIMTIRVPTRRPVQCIKFASATSLLFVQSDGCLFSCALDDSQARVSPKISSSVSCFALNDCPISDNPYAIQLAIGMTRREISIMEVVDHTFKRKSSHDTEDIPICLMYDGRIVCYATAVAYYVLHLDNRSNKHILDLDSERSVPIVKRISQNTYLLNSCQNLGVFTDNFGVSTQPPLAWSSSNVVALAYVHPYVVSLGLQFISVYSIDDQLLKQQLPFIGGRFLNDYEGKIFITTKDSVHQLRAVPWDKQVEALLEDKLADEAVMLAESSLTSSCNKDSCNKDSCLKIVKRIRVQAGFLKFEAGQFSEAGQLFLSGQLDALELICIYPNLLPDNLNFSPTSPPLHNIPNVEFICRSNPCFAAGYKHFLLDFLRSVRCEPFASRQRKVIDTVILKLLAEFDELEAMRKMLMSSDEGPGSVSVDQTDFTSYCNAMCYFNALATYSWNSDIGEETANKKEAIDIWIKLSDGLLTDNHNSIRNDVFDYLKLYGGASFDLMRDRLDWFLAKDLDSFVEILAACPVSQADEIADALLCNDRAFVAFLEFLIINKHSQREDFHLKLYKRYFALLANSHPLDEAICRNFRKFLYASDFYPVLNLLRAIKERHPEMLHDMAILHGKLKEHEKALNILVNQLEDYDAAEDYCSRVGTTAFASSCAEDRQRVYALLLQMYLTRKNDDKFAERTASLLKKDDLCIDLVQLIKLIPQHWTVSQINTFLTNGILKKQHRSATTVYSASLTKALNDQLTIRKLSSAKKSFLLEDTTRCPLCSNYFMDVECVIYPDGAIVHKTCFKAQQK